MVDKACLEKALIAAGKSFSPNEMEKLLTQFENRVKKKITGRDNIRETLDIKVIDEAVELAKELKLESSIAKRQKIINIFAARYRQDIIDQLPDSPELAIQALNVGLNKRLKGGRASVEQRQKATMYKLVGSAVSEMRKADVLDFFRTADEAFERLIAKDMEALNTDGKAVSGNAEATKIAKILNDVTETARKMQNDAGAYIGKRQGFIAPQSHDMYRLRKATYEKWRNDILPRLSDETFKDVDDVEDFMKSVYEGLISGIHHKVDSLDNDNTAGVFMPANRAAKASQHRVLHFKSSDDWIAYNSSYGSGSLRESVINGWNRSANNVGIMQVWGTNPRLAFDQTLQYLRNKYRDNPKVLDKLNQQRLVNQFDQIDGTANIPGDIRLAHIDSSVRALNSMTKLGGSVFSSITDVGTVGAELSYQTGSFLKGQKMALEARLESVSPDLRAETSDLIGVGMDSFLGNILSRFDSGDGVPGRITQMQNLFFKMNLQGWWDDSGRRGVAQVMSRELAMKSNLGFDRLDPSLSSLLKQYDIGASEWEVLRKHAKTASDNRSYITPDIAREITDEEIIAYRGAKKLTDGQIRRTRDELEQKLRMYFIDRSEFAMLRPGAYEKSVMYQGLKPGTPMGAVARMFWQFKSFSVAYMTKAVGRELYGRGGDAYGAIRGISSMILTTTALGYIAGAAKDIAKGKEPRDPQDFNTWRSALLQGGGLGIYGDFVFGEFNRAGGGLWSTALGPTAGNLEQVFRLYGALRDGDDAAAKTFRLVQNNIPFANLFYLRPALDYMVLYDLQEAVNPGSIRRMERQIERDNNQYFYMPPSSERLTPFTR